ncbi:tetratricopeptide repeat protein [Rhodoplanes sp. TEM]|uniref:Tetratricopeptide repeat protein n=1 Tax=Rhodoplanes tepidamans TaxID=200616 RepID=A0ABT5JIY0_RHOTP|nr:MULTISPECIES: tetratricopeptide repeat protein [Rhodoplanes]MDC7789673.1 tetratricopeptide repeat protein [Rhodoplanes tepidamans]MDC7983850.1 tetratricopeptide repeat protein [Rhodoplanes sp. TEM]MDQ0359141.1 Flp pilus assembly protein TadD [Rhodoplanes tepidamans]
MLRSLLLRLHERLALNAMAAGDYAKAERAFRRMQAIEGDTRRVLHNLALARLAQGDPAGAEAVLERLVDAWGAAPATLRALAEAAYLAGDRERALRRLRAALADPDCPERGVLTRRAALCEDAAAYARAMAGKRDFAEGTARLAAGDGDAAIAAFRRAAENDPTDFVALNNLGTLLMNHAGDRAAAAAVFEQALALSDQPLVRRNLAAAREAG